MVYAMRSNLRNTIDDILSSGLANSFQIPDTITDWKTRTQANAFGNSTWLLYQSTKTAGVSAGNITTPAAAPVSKPTPAAPVAPAAATKPTPPPAAAPPARRACGAGE